MATGGATQVMEKRIPKPKKIPGGGIGVVIHMKDEMEDPKNPGSKIETTYGQADLTAIKQMLDTLRCEYKDHIHYNPNYADLMGIVQNVVAKVDQKKYHFLIFIFIGHGSRENGFEILRLRDGDSIKVEDLYDKFTAANCKGLIECLKFFILQACRGLGLDTPVFLPAGSSPSVVIQGISQYNEFYILQPSFFAHMCFYYSYGHPRSGQSPFIQAVCRIFTAHYERNDVHSLGMIVGEELENESLTIKLDSGRTTQVTHCVTIISTLTRKVYFPGAKPEDPVPQVPEDPLPHILTSGGTEVYATKDINGKPYWAQVTHADGNVLLHSLRESGYNVSNICSKVYNYDQILTYLPATRDLVFLDLVINGNAQGRVTIKLKQELLYYAKYIPLMFTGEEGSSLLHKGCYPHCLPIDLTIDVISIIPKFPRDPQAGHTMVQGSVLLSYSASVRGLSFRYEQGSQHHTNNGWDNIGDIEEGLDILERCRKHPHQNEVTVQDCGIIFKEDKLRM